MPEITIKYKKPETLKILKGLAKYFDFKIETDKPQKKVSLDDILIPGTKPETVKINGVTIIPADKNVDPDDLSDLFSGKNIDAAKLRKEAWQRKS